MSIIYTIVRLRTKATDFSLVSVYSLVMISRRTYEYFVYQHLILHKEFISKFSVFFFLLLLCLVLGAKIILIVKEPCHESV
jgi:hypothetical protein